MYREGIEVLPKGKRDLKLLAEIRKSLVIFSILVIAVTFPGKDAAVKLFFFNFTIIWSFTKKDLFSSSNVFMFTDGYNIDIRRRINTGTKDFFIY